jgi:hypothetical protein
LCTSFVGCLWSPLNDKKVVGVFVRFRAPLLQIVWSRFGDYDNSLTQTRTFTPTTGNAIKIEFTEFATEQDYDFLEIIMDQLLPPLLGRFSGNTLPSSFTSTAVGGNFFSFRLISWLIKVGLQLYLVCL